MEMISMVNEKPVNSIEIFQKDIAEMLKVNKDAREQRIAIEDSLKLDPFIDHLYSEGEFEKLIFFEQRRTNELLTQLIQVIAPQEPQENKFIEIDGKICHRDTGLPVYPVGEPKGKTIQPEDEVPTEVSPVEPGETLDEMLPMAPGVIPDDTLKDPEMESLSPAEAASVIPSKPAIKKQAGRGRR